ncbi:PREDICTED: sphingosine-1-phosphate phosphatase 2-like [Dinoponera quadriceps]|uniref:Sphingosine-1-phosphate phosphatase 2-like n=1 Tax=Dinoponera quadriceps TaxID=609295 RepID=A0A6P3X182_DINQU|nr:PREDICTED: sphingosine-1-phosphate phosphatase 2-like [Dinoponera quadriceps]
MIGSEVIDYLKDSQLVADIQRFFGVSIHYYEKHYGGTSDGEEPRSSSDEDKCICTEVDHNEGNHLLTCRNRKTNGCDTNSKEEFNGYITQTEDESSDKHREEAAAEKSPHYTINNPFWYYLFLFGTELGDEIFYSAFIPFWFWNIDGAVGRRVVLVWATVMTIGQALKDVIRWPRPTCPPAARLQNKWSQEYGMPSTHAMIGVSIPFSVVLFTMNRYIYPVRIGCVVAFLWCALVSTSRLYLGMHTVLDIVVGVILAIVLMIPLVPLVDTMDPYVVTNFCFLTILIAVSIAAIVYYPCSDKWTPTRGDTTMVVSVTAGVHTGTWLNHYTGVLSKPLFSPPYHIIWPTYPMLGRLIFRTILGFCCVIATKAICKSFSYATMCAILRINSKELMKSQDYSGNPNKVFVDLVYKYACCFMIGVNTVYLLPNVFGMLGIERPTFYTEM